MNSSPIKSVVDSLERNGPMDKAEYTRQKVPEKLRMTDDPEKIAMIWQEVAYRLRQNSVYCPDLDHFCRLALRSNKFFANVIKSE